MIARCISPLAAGATMAQPAGPRPVARCAARAAAVKATA